MSFYRGDDTDPYGVGPEVVPESFGHFTDIPEGWRYEGRYLLAPGEASPYGTGLPSPGLAAAILGIPITMDLLPKSVQNVAARAEQVAREVDKWATIAATTIAPEGTTTGSAETSSQASSQPQAVSSAPPPASSAITYPSPGPQTWQGMSPWELAVLQRSVPVRSRSVRRQPVARRSRLSRTQQRALLRAVQAPRQR